MREIISIGRNSDGCEAEFHISDNGFNNLDFSFYVECIYYNSFQQKLHSDKDIMNFFDIEPHIYYEILNRNNGSWNRSMNRYYFKNAEDIEKIISEIESHLIMNKLVDNEQ